MTEQESYKSRAVEVRRSARAHVLEIRRARIAKRKANMAAQPDQMSGRMAAEVSASQDQIDDPGPTKDPMPEQHVDASVTQERYQSDASLADDLDDVAVKNAAMAELREPEEAEDLHLPEPFDEPVEEAADHPSAKEPAEVEPSALSDEIADETRPEPGGDLDRLPGAGPGLIWMLNQCDIFTLSDLSRHDADDLSRKLGVVGQILDVSSWISFASTTIDADESRAQNIT